MMHPIGSRCQRIQLLIESSLVRITYIVRDILDYYIFVFVYEDFPAWAELIIIAHCIYILIIYVIIFYFISVACKH